MEKSMTRYMFTALLMGLVSANSAYSTPTCDVNDATANSTSATQCAFSGSIGANPAAETTFVNTQWQSTGDPFFFIGKWDFDNDALEDSLTGYSLAVSLSSTYDENDSTTYKFDYSLTTTPSQAGTLVDWVLGIKQASGQAGGPNATTGAGFTAYLWEEISLDITGSFNSFFTITTPGGTSVSNAYSHASGFLRIVDDSNDDPPSPPAPGVPIPAPLALLGLGGLMLGWITRKSRA